jgi:hypothetical protein
MVSDVINPMDHKIRYVVDDVFGGYNRKNKLPRVLADLKKYLYLEGPLFFSENRLVTVAENGDKQGDYLLEVYKIKNSTQYVLFEFYGDLKSKKLRSQKKVRELATPMKPSKWHHMVITLIPKNRHVKKIVDEILKKYQSLF